MLVICPLKEKFGGNCYSPTSKQPAIIHPEQLTLAVVLFLPFPDDKENQEKYY